MIRFYDVENTAHIAQATLKRSTGVNGSKTITGEIIAGNAVINGIGRGWSLVFEDEPYIITYTKFNDQTNSVEFDAIQKFFWYFAKSGFYQEWNGSHTFTDYLDALFKNTGYEYILEANVAAFEKENWGMKNRLALFNDVISQAGVEFELIGKRVKITKSIGSDLSTIVRKGFNLSDMVKESSITDFVTYGKGFGAFNDSNDQSKGRLEVEYRSPLADIYGVLEADPLVDERYTIADSLLAAVKAEVDNSVAISIDLKIYDLPDADFTYQVPQAGDWIMAIDEAIGFSRRIRIINVDEEFDVNGKRIDYTATCGDLPVAVQQELAQSGQAHKIEQLTKDVDAAAISANGKNTNYYGSAEPSQPREGDLWYKKNGDDTELYVWANGRWEIVVSKNTGNIIDQKVDSKLVQLNADMSTANSNLQAAQQDVADLQVKLKDNDDIQAQLKNDLSENSTILEKAQADIVTNTNELTELDAKLKDNDDAQAQLQDDLAANTKVQDQLKKDLSDNTELMNQVKTDTTNSLEKVNEDLTQAKSDAAQAVKHVDKAVANAKLSADASGLSADSAQAASEAANAAKQLATEVSNNFATVKKQASTAAGNAATALEKAKSALDTASSVQTGMQPAITTAVDKAKGELSLAIKTVQSGLNGLSVGGRNYLQQSSTFKWPNLGEWHVDTEAYQGHAVLTGTQTVNNSRYGFSYTSLPCVNSDVVVSFYAKAAESSRLYSEPHGVGGGSGATEFRLTTEWVRYSYKAHIGQIGRVYWWASDANIKMWVTMPQVEIGTVVSDYHEAPEDVQSQITTNSTQITANSKLISASATQESVNTLTQQVTNNTAQLKLTATEANLKLATNAVDALTGRVTTAEGNITATSDALKAVYTKSETTNLLGGYATQTWAQNQIKTSADGLTAKLTSVQESVDGLSIGSRNLLTGTAKLNGAIAGVDTFNGNNVMVNSEVGLTGNKSSDIYDKVLTIIPKASQYTLSFWARSDVEGSATSCYFHSPNTTTHAISSQGAVTSRADGSIDFKLSTEWTYYWVTWTQTAASGKKHVIVGRHTRNSTGKSYYAELMMVEGNLPASWQPAPEDTATYTDTKVADLKLTVDGLSATFAKQTDLNKATSDFKVTADGLNLLTTATGTKGEKVTQVIADVNNIKTTMTGANGYTTRLQTLEGFQQTATSQLNGKASQSQVTQLDDQITSVVGGLSNPNLVLNSGLPTDKSSWLDAGDLSIGKHTFYRSNRANLFCINNSTTAKKTASTNRFKVTPGQSYTVSFKTFASSNSVHQDVFFLGRSASSTASSRYDKVVQLVNSHRYSPTGVESAKVTFTVPDDIDEGYLRFDNNGSTDGRNSVFFFTEIKCELGTLATPWESESSYSQITQLQDHIDERVIVDGKITAALSLSADGGGTVTIRGASLYVTAASHFDAASIQSAAIAGLAAEKITSGSISSDRLATTKLNADNITSGSISAARIASTAINADNIKSGTIAAERIATTELSATNITSGTFDASKMTVKNINAGSITSGSIATERLSTTKLNADNITSGSIAAERLAATKISATNIVGGTFDAGTMTVKRLSADMIATGTLDVSKLTAVKNFSATNIIGGTLDASTMTVKKLSASSITGGTIDGTNVNVIGLNASAITTGTIKGANLAINLNTGQVVFQSGRIHSADNTIDINVDSNYISTADDTTRVILKGGEMQFVEPNTFSTENSPYLRIYNGLSSGAWNTAAVVGRDCLTISNSANLGDSLMPYYIGKNTFSGLRTGKTEISGWGPTYVGGAERGVSIVGGSVTTTFDAANSSPYIRVGSSLNGQGVGNRIYMFAEYIHAKTIYKHTGSGSANVIVNDDGALVRTSSATKYKYNIERFRNTDMGEALLNLPQAHWYNKQDMQRYADDPQHYSMPELDYGMIAEDLAAAGLEDLVVRGDDGELEDIRYDRIGPALLPLLAQMKQEIEELKGEK